jgi:hypothetical protein
MFIFFPFQPFKTFFWKNCGKKDVELALEEEVTVSLYPFNLYTVGGLDGG